MIIGQNPEFHLSSALGKNMIFFPETTGLYEIDEDTYNYLHQNNEFMKYPEELKSLFIHETKIKNDGIKKVPKPENIVSLTLNVSQLCNMKCRYCFGNEGTYDNPGLMSFETAAEAFEKLFNNDFDGKYIHFFGGEPLLNFETIKKIVEYVKTFNQKPEYDINTNAVLLTEEMADFFNENGFTLVVSLDSYDEEKHNYLRPMKDGSNSYLNTIKSIQLLMKKKSKFRVRATLTSFNIPRQFKQDFSKYIEYYNISSSLKEFIPSMEEYEEYLLNAYTNVIEQNDRAFFPRYENSYYKNIKERAVSELYCKAGINSLNIGADGKIYYCHRLSGMNEFLVGDINKFNEEEIKNNIARIFKEYHNRLRFDETCRKCWARYLCSGGCIQERLESEKLEDKETYCWMIKRNAEYLFSMITIENQ